MLMRKEILAGMCYIANPAGMYCKAILVASFAKRLSLACFCLLCIAIIAASFAKRFSLACVAYIAILAGVFSIAVFAGLCSIAFCCSRFAEVAIAGSDGSP